MEEEWKDIEGYEELYQISNLGRIKSLHNKFGDKELIMKQNLKRNGYYQIRLKKNGTVKDFIVHRLVAIAFIDNPLKLPCVNHIDENKKNNNVDNLEWCTILYNNTYGTRIERVKAKVSKSVTQYDLNGKLIKHHCSISEAARYNNISASEVCKCLKGEYKQSHGYIFKGVV